MKKFIIHSFYLSAILMLGSCTNVHLTGAHYVENYRSDSIMVKYTLQSWIEPYEQTITDSFYVPAQYATPFMLDSVPGGEIKPPSQLFESIIVLSLNGDTLLCLPKNSDDKWLKTQEIAYPSLYKRVDIWIYKLAVR